MDYPVIWWLLNEFLHIIDIPVRNYYFYLGNIIRASRKEGLFPYNLYRRKSVRAVAYFHKNIIYLNIFVAVKIDFYGTTVPQPKLHSRLKTTSFLLRYLTIRIATNISYVNITNKAIDICTNCTQISNDIRCERNSVDMHASASCCIYMRYK